MASYTAGNSTCGDIWNTWNSVGTSSATTGGEMTASIWCNWITVGTSSATTGITTSSETNEQTWVYWVAHNSITGQTEVYQQPQVYKPPVLTPEQVEAQRVAAEVAKVAAEAKAKAEKEAADRAEEILLEHLEEPQKKQWKERQEFVVLSQTGRKFKITKQRNQNVLEINRLGKRMQGFCIVRPDVPLSDQLLMQKLLLEHAEDDFMRIAHQFN
jgi:hypothetical protein